jgi:threonyl-tRNA synthetase
MLTLSTLRFCHAFTETSIFDGGPLVVGQEELESRSVNVRNRDDVGTKAKTAMMPLDIIISKLLKLKTSKSLQNTLPE